MLTLQKIATHTALSDTLQKRKIHTENVIKQSSNEKFERDSLSEHQQLASSFRVIRMKKMMS